MDSLPIFVWAMVLGSTVAVGFDAHRLGSSNGRPLPNGASDLGVAGYAFFCLFLWIIGMPYYLIVARPGLRAERRRERVAPRPEPTYGHRDAVTQPATGA